MHFLTNLDINTFFLLNSATGNSRLVDFLIVFFASYLAFLIPIVFLVLLYRASYPFREKLWILSITIFSAIFARFGIAVEGIVDKITHEPDGDYHILIRPQYLPLPVLVTETIPEIKDFPLPKEGDYIKIWGITRFDEPHNWWELHPVIGWEKL